MRNLFIILLLALLYSCTFERSGSSLQNEAKSLESLGKVTQNGLIKENYKYSNSDTIAFKGIYDTLGKSILLQKLSFDTYQSVKGIISNYSKLDTISLYYYSIKDIPNGYLLSFYAESKIGKQLIIMLSSKEGNVYSSPVLLDYDYSDLLEQKEDREIIGYYENYVVVGETIMKQISITKKEELFFDNRHRNEQVDTLTKSYCLVDSLK